MNLEIFEPYFINVRTMQKYYLKNVHFSINDIIKKLIRNMRLKKLCKLYY